MVRVVCDKESHNSEQGLYQNRESTAVTLRKCHVDHIPRWRIKLIDQEETHSPVKKIRPGREWTEQMNE